MIFEHSGFSRRVLLLSGLAATTMPSWAASADDLKMPVDRGVVPGLAIASVNTAKSEISSYGVADRETGRPLDQTTVFGIGSLTKLFTALVLADMAERSEVAFADNVQKYVPANVKVPDFEGRPITLIDLATYHPGLPGWPNNLTGLAVGKPFPDYTVGQLYQALASTKLDHAPGSRYAYSNFGYGLLGIILANRAGVSFEELVLSRVCVPLGMADTRITLTQDMRTRLAVGYDNKLNHRLRWDLPDAIAGAGGFYSTAYDMGLFLSAALRQRGGPLASSFEKMLSITLPGDKPGSLVASGWFIRVGDADRIIWKDGGVPGYTSVLAYSEKKREGVFAATNGEWGGLNDYAMHMLEPSIPMPKL